MRLRRHERHEAASLVVVGYMFEGKLRLGNVLRSDGDIRSRFYSGNSLSRLARHYRNFVAKSYLVRARADALYHARVLVQTRVRLLKQTVDDINDPPPIAVYSFDVG